MSTVKLVADTLDVTDEQCVLIIAITCSFILQALVLYMMKPDKFTLKWFITCLLFCILYNISYFKFFL